MIWQFTNPITCQIKFKHWILVIRFYWWWWLTFTETKFGLLDLKKENTWFTLQSCSYAQKTCQEAFQAHYSFGKLAGYKGLCCSKYYETQI